MDQSSSCSLGCLKIGCTGCLTLFALILGLVFLTGALQMAFEPGEPNPATERFVHELPGPPEPPEPSTGGPAPAPPGLSCSGVLDCAASCPDGSCTNTCIQQGDREAQALIDALIGCLEQSGCNEDCDQVCAQPLAECDADR